MAKLERFPSREAAEAEIKRVVAQRKAMNRGATGRTARKCPNCYDGWHIKTAAARADWTKKRKVRK